MRHLGATPTFSVAVFPSFEKDVYSVRALGQRLGLAAVLRECVCLPGELTQSCLSGIRATSDRPRCLPAALGGGLGGYEVSRAAGSAARFQVLVWRPSTDPTGSTSMLTGLRGLTGGCARWEGWVVASGGGGAVGLLSPPFLCLEGVLLAGGPAGGFGQGCSPDLGTGVFLVAGLPN